MIKAPVFTENRRFYPLVGETSVNYPNTFYFIKGSFAFIIKV